MITALVLTVCSALSAGAAYLLGRRPRSLVVGVYEPFRIRLNGHVVGNVVITQVTQDYRRGLSFEGRDVSVMLEDRQI